MASSQVHRKGPTAPDMNLTPMIDVVFQLIIFFMLVNNIISEEAVQMIVPALQDPVVKKAPEEMKKITVNIVPPLDVRDRRREPGYMRQSFDALGVKIGASKLYPLTDEALEQVTDYLKAETAEGELTRLSEKNPNPVQILLRADAATKFADVARVIKAITAADISDIQLIAYEEEQADLKGRGG